MRQPFTSVDDQFLREVIAKARQRLVFIAPGIRPPVAEAVASAVELGGICISSILSLRAK